jgi:ketosteroid isomerase-like protein
VAAFNAKDAAAVASLFVENGELAPPGGPLFKGRTTIEAALRRTFAQDTLLELTPVESRVAGTYAFDAGTFAVTTGSVDDAGTPEVFGGTYLTVLTREGQDWKMAYHMYHLHTDVVASVPPEPTLDDSQP